MILYYIFSNVTEMIIDTCSFSEPKILKIIIVLFFTKLKCKLYKYRIAGITHSNQ